MAKWAGYRWTDWVALPRIDRVDAIAHYRVSLLIEIHQQDAAERAAKERMNRERTRRGRSGGRGGRAPTSTGSPTQAE